MAFWIRIRNSELLIPDPVSDPDPNYYIYRRLKYEGRKPDIENLINSQNRVYAQKPRVKMYPRMLHPIPNQYHHHVLAIQKPKLIY
jgi:hypothetical protein